MSGLAFEVDAGALAGHPGESLVALILAAEADGADPDEWLQKALVHVGATRASVTVRGEPRYRVIEEATDEAAAALRVAMGAAHKEIVALLRARRAGAPSVRP